MDRPLGPPSRQGPSLLKAALACHQRGWSIIPIKPGTKEPLCRKWKPYQTTRPTEKQLQTWFSGDKRSGLAVILGEISGGLVCRDFDVMGAYEAWAADHPDMAAMLPTVATSRGRHVYFDAPPADLFFVDLRTLDPPEEGEYRGDSGHYCLLPPSRHPDGPIYTWLVPLPDGAIPFVADVRAAGLLPNHATERTESTECTERTQRTEDNGGIQRQLEGGAEGKTHTTNNCPVLSVLSVASESIPPDIERAILETIPSRIGRRNRQVFELARVLKSIPRLRDAPVDTLEPCVRVWHDTGVANKVIATEPFEESWIDFLQAWPKVRFPKGDGPMVAAFKQARQSPAPRVAEMYEHPGIRLLVSVCRELQRASGEQPFFLDCRTAGRHLGVDHVTAWRWLWLLAHDKILQEVEKGTCVNHRATRFRYLGD